MEFNSYAISESKDLLNVGTHSVVIDKVYTGYAKNGVKYIDCIFKNETGLFRDKIYFHNDRTTKAASFFVDAIGLDMRKNIVFTENDVVGKPIKINIGIEETVDFRTGELIQKLRIKEFYKSYHTKQPYFQNKNSFIYN